MRKLISEDQISCNNVPLLKKYEKMTNNMNDKGYYFAILLDVFDRVPIE